MLTRDNIGEEVDFSEIRGDMLNMLETLAEVCEANGLRYYLDGGTLIGAARHKGFIPWDDDIDVMMPKPDLIRLKEITGGKLGSYHLADPADQEYDLAEIWMICNDKYIFYNTMNGVIKPMFIDIEPMVGFPDTEEEIHKTFRNLKIYRSLLQCCKGKAWHGSSFPVKVYHLLLRPFVKLVGYRRIFEKLEAEKDKYSFEEKEYVGNMCSPVARWRGRVRREDYTRPNSLEFEGRMYSVPGNYVEYLEPLYGKNCTTKLPPEESRHSEHDRIIYRYKES